MEFIEALEQALGKNAEKNMMGMQNGDVVATCANVDALANAIGFKPSTSLKQGIEKFVEWYRGYYGYT